jgi:diguanylate cyclase (GGDEF)-like protein/PAS domain S-box-containing protein
MILQFEADAPRNRDDRFQQLVDCIEIDAIYMLDCAGHVLTWNRGAEMNKGYRKDEILGQHFKTFFVPEDVLQDVPGKMLDTAKREGRVAGEGWRLRKNGERFWASFTLTSMKDRDGKLLGFAKVLRDLTDRKRQEDAFRSMEAALREQHDRLHAATESMLDAFFVCEAVRGLNGRIEDFVFTYLNSNVEKLLKRPRSGLLGNRLSDVLPKEGAALFERYKSVVMSGRPWVEEFAEDRAMGERWLRVQAVKLGDGLAITVSDITDRKLVEKSVEHRAQHDDLTGLANRSLLDDRIRQATARAKRVGCMVGIILVDLDGFKQVNDNHGHAAGDEILCMVARRMMNVIRSSDSMIRLGGDEFVAVIPDLQRLTELIGVVDKLLGAIRPPMFVGSTKICLTCSIGISVFPESGSSPAELLRKADTAMYASKNSGKDQFKIFGHRKHPAKGQKAALSIVESEHRSSTDQVTTVNEE